MFHGLQENVYGYGERALVIVRHVNVNGIRLVKVRGRVVIQRDQQVVRRMLDAGGILTFPYSKGAHSTL